MLAQTESCKEDFQCLAQILYNCRRMTSAEADEAVLQYKKLLESIPSKRTEFENFSRDETRLDEFLCSITIGYTALLKAIKIVMVVFHGNAAVERGFNINKETSSTNMQSRSLRSQRLVYDSLHHQIDQSYFCLIFLTYYNYFI